MESDRFSQGGTEENIIGAVGDPGGDKFVVRHQCQSDDAAGSGTAVGHQVGFFDQPFFCGHEDKVARFKRRNCQYGRELFVFFKTEQVYDGLSTALPSGLGDVINFAPVHLTFVGKE